MASYDSYKDSGVKWLGQIPSHWEVRSNISLMKEIKTTVGERKDLDLLSLTLKGVIFKDKDSGEGKMPSSFDNYKVILPNNIIFCLFDIDETPRTVGVAHQKGMITGAYDVFEVTGDANVQFVYYYYLSIDYRKGLKPYYTGLRKVVKPSIFKHLQIPLPPIEEQLAIVEYMDKVTGEIDRAIEAQQKMIDALNERKQIIITRSFQNENSEWDYIPFRHVFEMRGGYTPSKADPSLWENGTIPWYRMEDIRKSGRFLNEAIQYVNRKAVKAKGTFKAGSFIMAICTASIGEHAMLIADSLANQRFANL